MERNFELRDHTADIGVYATGGTLGDVFAALADGLTAAMCDELVSGGDSFELSVRAESREALLFEYLDDLIYERDVRNVLPVDHEVTVRGGDDGERTGDNWTLEGRARGIPLSDVTAREVKAVTYSEMRLAETDTGWEAYVVFDV